MAGRDPDEIWRESVAEGERRLARRPVGLTATGIIGGADVMIGVLALAVVSGALAVSLPEQIAHVGGSLVFGIGFVLLIVGRSELFTEGFLVPFAGLANGRTKPVQLGKLWFFTALGNLGAMIVIALMLTRSGVVPSETLTAAGSMADTFAERDFVAALFSAIVAGALMTLLTWLAIAVELDVSRVIIALLIGFVLALPTLNHAIVGFGEMSLGLLAGETETATWADLGQNFPVAVLGNFLGGFLFVFAARVFQVQGEPAEAPAQDG